jgi:photosystem II stability/assembly factor-like uncharacterized protein
MKRVLFFIGILSCVLNANAQWKKVVSPSTQDLYGVTLLKNMAYAVGNNSTLLKSKDTGKTWTKLALPTLYNLRALYFFDSLHGIITGENARMLKTKDGGKLWTQTYVKTAAYANAIYFQGQHGAAVGKDFLAVSSSDSGKTWNVDTTASKFIKLQGVTIMPNGNCWAVGDSGYLLNKKVGAKKWQINRLATNVNLTGITYIGNHTLIVVGGMPDTVNLGKFYNLMARSTDSGKTWQINNISEMRLINGLSFSHPDSGYLIGSSGLISKCNNGFSNRGLQLTGIASAFNGISINNKYGVIVGDGGTIVRTNNAGGSPLLNVLKPALNTAVYTVYPNPSNGHFFISSQALAIGFEIFNMQGQLVLRSDALKSVHELELPNAGLYTIRLKLADGASQLHTISVVK